MGVDRPFGGKVIVFLGDFRQVLPVVPRGTTYQMVNASLKKSHGIWPHVAVRKLTVNMRVKMSGGADKAKLAEFADYLLSVGNGTVPVAFGKDHIRIPDHMCLARPTRANVIAAVYGDLATRHADPEYLFERTILTSLNKDVDGLNQTMADKFPSGDPVEVMYSADEVTDNGEGALEVSTEFLNSLTPSGIPPHKLGLKVGMPVMLMRNINPAKGHCNGTRYILKSVSRHLLELSMRGSGATLMVPRFLFVSDPTAYPFTLRRRQFPVRPAFAMTVHKSQGQTLRRVGLYMPKPMFAHGMLYVAMSRVGQPEDIVIAIEPSTMAAAHAAENGGGHYTRNVVHHELIDK